MLNLNTQPATTPGFESPYRWRNLLEKLRATAIPSFILEPLGMKSAEELEAAANAEAQAEATNAQRLAEKAREKADKAVAEADALEAQRFATEQLRHGLADHLVGQEKKLAELKVKAAALAADVPRLEHCLADAIVTPFNYGENAALAFADCLNRSRVMLAAMPAAFAILQADMVKVRRELAAIK